MKLPDSFEDDLLVALLNAFRTPGELNGVVNRAAMEDGGIVMTFNMFQAPGTPLPTAVGDLITWVVSHGYVIRFLQAAKHKNNSNKKLNALLARFDVLNETFLGIGGTEEDSSLGEAERLVFKDFTFENVDEWLTDMGRKRRAVCRIEPQPQDPGDLTSLKGYGTGFLVAPNVVMTNAHVAGPFFKDATKAAKVVCRFDYETSAATGKTSQGTPHTLHATEWGVLLGKSSELDFALLKLRDRAGDETIGGQPRGWLTPVDYPFQQGEGLVIYQHPMAAPLKLALGPVVQPKVDTLAVSYKVNTQGGSSGSPCFTQDRKVGAIHYYGDTVNRGILMSSVLKQLKAADKSDRDRLVAAGLEHLL